LDNGFYSKDYILGWISESYLRLYIERTYGVYWFINKNAGIFLRELWNQENFYEHIGVNEIDEKLLVEKIIGNLL